MLIQLHPLISCLQRLHARGWRLALLTFSTLGVVYGDIGERELLQSSCELNRIGMVHCCCGGAAACKFMTAACCTAC